MRKDKTYFDRLFRLHHRRELVCPDPLQFLYSYPDVNDREIAALVCACFAYGNVKQILKNLTLILGKMDRPHAFILAASAAKLRRTFAGFKYRFTTAEELCVFLLAIKKSVQKYGSLHRCFLAHYRTDATDVREALCAFARELRSFGDIGTLVPDPDKNSALKRLNLFLRWMVRCDEVDPGGWNEVSPAKLIVPLDVHMHRIAKLLRLTRRNAADMKTAVEISRALALFCPEDPIRYDFCLTRFGIREDMSYNDL